MAPWQAHTLPNRLLSPPLLFAALPSFLPHPCALSCVPAARATYKRAYICAHTLSVARCPLPAAHCPQVYVHSKVTIVDDAVAFIGSCNINDRSLLADTDTELCIRISGGDQVGVYMNGVPATGSRFVHSLRVRLWREHLGLLDPASSSVDVSDPVCDAVYSLLWRNRAMRNTLYYEKTFPSTRRYTAMYTDEELAGEELPALPQGFVVTFAAQYSKASALLSPFFKVMPLNVFK
jgi:phosphatidylserine/phosphatidylglycerophosphate/cardiolipin synthase-like enzyme